MRLFLFFLLCLAFSSCIVVPRLQHNSQTPTKSSSAYTQVDLEEMIRRYIAKTHTPESPSIEGIYSVSGVVTKKGGLFSFLQPGERVVNRRDNYARVAIMKDWPGSKTDYVEISLNQKSAPKYPIVATLDELSEGNGFMYKHFEPKGEVMTFTFLYDKNNTSLLEGVYTVTKGKAEVTYKLTYVKVYPKGDLFID